MAIAEEFGSRRKYRALLLAPYSAEARELYDEINNNQRYGIFFVEKIDTSSSFTKSEEIMKIIKIEGISLIIADFSDKRINELMPTLYRLIFSKVNFVDIQKMY